MREAVYTKQDLMTMQAWPLARKIQVTQAKILEWYHHYGGKVAVSFSGGKDNEKKYKMESTSLKMRKELEANSKLFP